MGAKTGYPRKGAKTPGLFLVSGYFVTNGNDAPVTVSGAGFTVSAPTAGVYTITLTDGPFNDVNTMWCTIMDPAANSTARVLFGSILAVGTSGQFSLVTQSTAGTDANLAANAAIIAFGLELRDTTATR